MRKPDHIYLLSKNATEDVDSEANGDGQHCLIIRQLSPEKTGLRSS